MSKRYIHSSISQNKMNETITIIKGNFLVTKEVTTLLKNEENIVISLDYESHKKLKALNIKHDSYENYLSETDKQSVDDAVLNITTNWYKNKKIQEHLTLNEINLGWLLVQEFFPHFLTIITNFVTLLKINEKENPATIIISNDLMEMATIAFPNSKIQVLEEKNTQLFTFDVYSIKYNIGHVPLTIRIPRRYFFALRNHYEKLFISIFNKIYSKIDRRKKSILLVDFNPAREDEFLKYLSKKNKNIILLNRRRVAIWNFKSFKVVRKTKCIPVTYESFLEKSDKKEIDHMVHDMKLNLDSLLSDNGLFSEIFSIDGHSFWNYMRKYFKNYCLDRFEEAIYEMVGSKKLLSEIKPYVILHFYAAALQEKILIHEAKKQNISTILVQHGTPHLSLPGWPKLNPITSTLPLYDEKIAVWGNVVKEYAIKNGMKEDDIIVSGSIRHDGYFAKKNSSSDEGTILIALMPFVIIYTDDQTLSAYDRYEESLKIICNAVKKINNRKKIAKLHPADMVFNTVYVEPIIRSIDPSIQIIVDADLSQLIPSASVVITLGLTTFILDSNIFKRPTMSIIYNQGEYMSRLSNGYSKLFFHSDSVGFEKYLNEILTDDKIRQENVKKGTEFVNSYLANHGTASEYLAKKITE